MLYRFPTGALTITVTEQLLCKRITLMPNNGGSQFDKMIGI